MPDMSLEATAGEFQTGHHAVQLYEDESILASTITPFLSAGLSNWEGVLVIATPAHWALFKRTLRATATEVSASIEQGQLIVHDAETLLAQFMVDGMPDSEKFNAVIGGAIRNLAARYPRIRAYGEMVNLLWLDGQVQAAVRVEELWNNLIKAHPFLLFCAYQMDGFDQAVYQGPLQDVCRTHSQLFPMEDGSRLERAVSRALADILGPAQAEILRASLAKHPRSTTAMPEAQAILFWLQKQMSTMADVVLARARRYYHEDAPSARTTAHS